ncbi:MAG: hypothetical protein HC836_36825 [Richelia sp. RM2_1_2]|nr:hypothetical protein [Richelia sp. RM1_1_1]NJO63561.1 hypothetical protein [Richelia sp. RM2_1_2]
MSNQSNEENLLFGVMSFGMGVIKGIANQTIRQEYHDELEIEKHEHPDESGMEQMGHAIGRTISHFFQGSDNHEK